MANQNVIQKFMKYSNGDSMASRILLKALSNFNFKGCGESGDIHFAYFISPTLILPY